MYFGVYFGPKRICILQGGTEDRSTYANPPWKIHMRPRMDIGGIDCESLRNKLRKRIP